MAIISLINRKGGVGKSTISINLAAGLARSGRRVLLIDTDSQGQAGRALGCSPEIGLAELVLGEARPQEAIHPARENLWLLAGGRSLSGLKRWITRKDYGGEQTLAEALSPLEDQYDLAILDTSPGWDALTVNALFYAERILAPVALEVLALQGLLEFQASLAAIQRYHPRLLLSDVLPTFLDRRGSKTAGGPGHLQGQYSAQLFAAPRYCRRPLEWPAPGPNIFEYAPQSTGAEDYQKLTERILSHGEA